MWRRKKKKAMQPMKHMHWFDFHVLFKFDHMQLFYSL